MVRLYVEGGGDNKALKSACRKGFRLFLEKAGLMGRMPTIIACGSRDNAYSRFRTALKQYQNEMSLLLVDSESPVSGADGPWVHLHRRDNWSTPQNSGDDNVYLMVQCMETWLIADANTLLNFFGQDFKPEKLPKHSNLEEVDKKDIYRSLEEATKRTKAGPYGKGQHSFDLLGKIDPELVRNRCAHAERFIVFLLNTL